MKILVMGLPGAGKTYLAERLAGQLRAVHLNADRIRATISTDLGFALEDRVEHARRMGWMAQLIKDSGIVSIADFVCPTPETRKAFDADLTIWLDTIEASRYEDTNRMFVPPQADIVIKDLSYDLHELANDVAHCLLRSTPTWATLEEFDQRSPTALLLGRYQPFHEGHYQLSLEALQRVGSICIAVRNTTGLEKNPFSFEDVATRIQAYFAERGTWDPKKISIISVPNITSITYGRDVGYTIDKIDLDAAVQAISATEIRKQMGL